MANHIYMQILGDKSQMIKAEATDSAHAGWLELSDINTNVNAPRDLVTGKPTGKRTHAPITCFMRVDASTPELTNFCIRNKRINQIDVRFYRSHHEQDQELYFTITLWDAYVTSAGFDAQHGSSHDNFTFTLQFRAIEWRHTVAKRACVDNIYQRADKDVSKSGGDTSE